MQEKFDDNEAGHGGEDNIKDCGSGIDMDDLEYGKESSRNLFNEIEMGLDRSASNDADVDVEDTKAAINNAAASITVEASITTTADTVQARQIVVADLRATK